MLHPQPPWRSHHQVDADAIPLLSAGDELPLLHRQADDDGDDADAAADVDSVTHSSSRRKKRYSGGEFSSSSSTNNMARFVRRRGRSASVPTATTISPTEVRGAVDEHQFIRGRAGSAAATFGASSSVSARRRAASSLLSRFRRRKDLSDAAHMYDEQQRRPAKGKRRVHFKTSLYPEVVPDPRAHVASYDELLFSVGGLYQTLSFLHDPPPPPDDVSTDSSSSGGALLLLDDALPPPERSMQLMIAEFLFRSAVYLGYADNGTPWLPGFRDAKRYSVNDVKRWRRLAHHDWEHEEQQLQLQAATGTAQRRKSSAGSGGSGSRLRAAVTSWLQRRRRHSAPARLAMNHPPPVPADTDLSLLVTIANSCVYYGAFRLTARDIRLLCNIDIDSKPALGAP